MPRDERRKKREEQKARDRADAQQFMDEMKHGLRQPVTPPVVAAPIETAAKPVGEPQSYQPVLG